MEKKSKILIINYELPPIGGGGGVATYTLAKGLVKMGYEVDYITTWFTGLKKTEVLDGISVYRIRVIGRNNLYTASMMSLLSFPFFAVCRGIALCMKNNYSLISTHFVIPSGPLGFLLSQLFNIKHVISLYGGDIYDPTKKSSPHLHWFLRKTISFLLNSADSVIAESSNIKENCVKYYSPKKEIDIIPLPYEIKQFTAISKENLGLSENKKYIISIGRLVKRKGFDFFVRALAELDNSIEGIIIGDGPEFDNLKALSIELGVSERIHWTGYIDENKKFQYLSNSNVYVLSSIHEGFGIVLQEAMQVGLPIVATGDGGQTDFIKDGENGFLIPISDEKALASAINQIVNSKDIADKMKSNNIEAVKKFDTELLVTQYINIPNKSF